MHNRTCWSSFPFPSICPNAERNSSMSSPSLPFSSAVYEEGIHVRVITVKTNQTIRYFTAFMFVEGKVTSSIATVTETLRQSAVFLHSHERSS